MTPIQKHAVLSACGAAAGMACVAWAEPETQGGATFLVAVAVLIVNAVGALAWREREGKPKPGGPATAEKPAPPPAAWLLALLAGAAIPLSGCRNPPPPAPPPAPAPAPAPAPDPAAKAAPAPAPQPPARAPGAAAQAAAPSLIPVRAFARARDIPGPDVGAYGVVAFRQGPTPDNAARLAMACSAFLASLAPRGSLGPDVPPARQMITYWPLDKPGAAEAAAGDCAYLTAHYELEGGLSAVEDASRQGHALSGPGPFLIAWSPSQSRGRPDAVVLAFDLSDRRTQRDFDDAFRLWQERIVQDAALWRRGFTEERLRGAVRGFADEYGEAILKGLEFWKT